MRCRGAASAALLYALLWAPPLPAETAEERGDRLYRQRAAGFESAGEPDPEPIASAVAAYQKALEQNPESFRLHVKLMDALYFRGYYVVEDERRQRQIFDRLLDLAERALDLVERRTGRQDELASLALEEQAEILEQIPEAAEAHFWIAAGWGLWGKTHSALAALRKGVAGKVRDHARLVVLLDESYDDAAGLRILGRLHTKSPKVPLITGWIDRQEGLSLLRRALQISRQDPQTLLFLAEAILEHDRDHRAEALELLRELERREPRPHELYEDSEVLRQARQLLAEVTGGRTPASPPAGSAGTARRS